MKADLRILRTFPQDAIVDLPKNGMITIQYPALDPNSGEGGRNSFEFPQLSKNDVYTFPFKDLAAANHQPAELLHEQTLGLLIPCVKRRAQEHADSTCIEFLKSELAATLESGTYPQLLGVGGYLGTVLSYDDQQTAPILHQRIQSHIGENDVRWLQIATAIYSSMGMPRPKISDLMTGQNQPSPQAFLVSKALSHLKREGIDERLIEESMGNVAALAPWGVAVTLFDNYPDHPTVIKLLKKSLEEDGPHALYVAAYLIKERNHPLASTAVAAAVRLLKQHKTSDDLYFCCALIRDFGTDDDFKLLLEEFVQSQKSDRETYQKLWQSCAYGKSPRIIAICRIVIQDENFSFKTSEGFDLRYCDSAVFELQRATPVDFGMKVKQTLPERNQAVEKVKAWLAKELRK